MGLPYHLWTRLTAASAGTAPPVTGPNLDNVFSCAFALGGHTPSDVVERVFLDVSFSVRIDHFAGSTLVRNDWISSTTPLVAGAVVGAVTHTEPDPIDTSGSQAFVTLTGALHPTTAGLGPLPHSGSDVSWFAGWGGSFESQGVRKSPAPGEDPAYQVGFRLIDLSGWVTEPLVIPYTWNLNCYLRVLYGSSTPF